MTETALNKLADDTWLKIAKAMDKGAADEAFDELMMALRRVNFP